MPGFQGFYFCCCDLASLRRSLGGLGRRVHCRFVGAHVTEQDRSVRQVFLHQAGAGSRNRAADNRVAGVAHVGPTNPVAAPVVVMTVVVVVPVVPVVVVMMTVVTMVVVTVMADHVVMTMATTAVTAATMTATAHAAAAMTAGVSTGSNERCQTDDSRGNESEECSTFEHCQRPSWLDVNHPEHWSKQPGIRFKRLIFVMFSFI
jgi:hypothetical protein